MELTGTVELTVNRRTVAVEVDPRMTLLDFLRDELGLTGSHTGCEQGACGACNVLLDGRVVRSCLVLAVGAEGSEVTTVEDLGTPEHLHPVQEALWRHHGLQCGYCTPGVVMAAVDLLSRVGAPTEHQVRDALSGNLCRCTGYAGMVAAIVEAGAARAGDGP